MNVRLSKFHREEIGYKLQIMEEGFDNNGDVQEGYMAHTYGWKRIDDLEEFQKKLWTNSNAPSLDINLTEQEAKTAWGELENLYDIAVDNIDYYEGMDAKEVGKDYKFNAKRYKEAMKRIEAAFPNVEFK